MGSEHVRPKVLGILGDAPRRNFLKMKAFYGAISLILNSVSLMYPHGDYLSIIG